MLKIFKKNLKMPFATIWSLQIFKNFPALRQPWWRLVGVAPP
jgi:hypothetical protein